jgi:hypothetical protein
MMQYVLRFAPALSALMFATGTASAAVVTAENQALAVKFDDAANTFTGKAIS